MQTEFLNQISKALGRPFKGVPDEKPAISLPPRSIDTLDIEPSLQAFIQSFQAMGGELHRADGWDAGNAILQTIIKESSISPDQVAMWGTSGLQAIAKLNQKYHVNPDIETTSQCKLGITEAFAAVAETGSFALIANPGQGRVVSLLPDNHLIFFTRNILVKTMGDVFTKVKESNIDFRALNFITGPSRTSDIEMDLTIGVHGPKKIIAILMENDLVS